MQEVNQVTARSNIVQPPEVKNNGGDDDSKSHDLNSS